MGGPKKNVETDESLFIKVKHLKGKVLRDHKYGFFGLYERETEKCFFVEVLIRDTFTLLNQRCIIKTIT